MLNLCAPRELARPLFALFRAFSSFACASVVAHSNPFHRLFSTARAWSSRRGVIRTRVRAIARGVPEADPSAPSNTASAGRRGPEFPRTLASSASFSAMDTERQLLRVPFECYSRDFRLSQKKVCQRNRWGRLCRGPHCLRCWACRRSKRK